LKNTKRGSASKKMIERQKERTK